MASTLPLFYNNRLLRKLERERRTYLLLFFVWVKSNIDRFGFLSSDTDQEQDDKNN